MTADCSWRRGDISKPQPASKCYFIVFSHGASLKPRDPNWHVQVHLDAKSDAERETFNGCFLKRNIYRTNLHAAKQNKTSLHPPETIIGQNPIFPNNEAITVVNVWLIFIDAAHSCSAHLAVQCKQLERLLWSPPFLWVQNAAEWKSICALLKRAFSIHNTWKDEDFHSRSWLDDLSKKDGFSGRIDLLRSCCPSCFKRPAESTCSIFLFVFLVEIFQKQQHSD